METKTKISTSKTHWKKLHNPNYLGSYSLDEGKDLILTIKTVVKEVVKTEREDQECTVIHFVENAKPMIVNVTNAKQIERIYKTPYIEEWSGMKIQLYSAKIRAFGEDIEALRIRPSVPKVTKTPFTPSHAKWNNAKKALAEGNTTLAAILKNYSMTEADQTELLKA